MSFLSYLEKKERKKKSRLRAICEKMQNTSYLQHIDLISTRYVKMNKNYNKIQIESLNMSIFYHQFYKPHLFKARPENSARIILPVKALP